MQFSQWQRISSATMSVTPTGDRNQEVRKAPSILEEVFALSSLEVVQSRPHADSSLQPSSAVKHAPEPGSGSGTGAPPPSVQNLLGLSPAAPTGPETDANALGLDLRRSENLWQQRAEMQRTTEMIAQQASQWRVLFEKLAGAVDQRVDSVDSKLTEFVNSQRETAMRLATVQDATRRADREDILAATDQKLGERLQQAILTVEDTFKNANEELARARRVDNQSQRQLVEESESRVLQVCQDQLSTLRKEQGEASDDLLEKNKEFADSINLRFETDLKKLVDEYQQLGVSTKAMEEVSSKAREDIDELKETQMGTFDQILDFEKQWSERLREVRDLVDNAEIRTMNDRKIVHERLDQLELSAKQALELAHALQTNLDLSAAAARSAQKAQAGLQERVNKLEQQCEQMSSGGTAKEIGLERQVSELSERLRVLESKMSTHGAAVSQQAHGLEECESGLEKVKLRLKEETKRRLADMNSHGTRVRQQHF